jgi:hypothetical protein
MKHKAYIRQVLEARFPWLTNGEDAPGADTVDAVMELFMDAGGEVLPHAENREEGDDVELS